ncbi:MAG: hypothetical protein KC910_04910 [Candidatus Eremiobacteraeota bacterium]|nr:hypothetical protein [Candidatus Eremiobacteraeota bacterium]
MVILNAHRASGVFRYDPDKLPKPAELEEKAQACDDRATLSLQASRSAHEVATRSTAVGGLGALATVAGALLDSSGLTIAGAVVGLGGLAVAVYQNNRSLNLGGQACDHALKAAQYRLAARLSEELAKP